VDLVELGINPFFLKLLSYRVMPELGVSSKEIPNLQSSKLEIYRYKAFAVLSEPETITVSQVRVIATL
jgi:hypothetical protein